MANNIAFRQIPATLRLPLFWAEVDPTQANSNTQPQRSLIIGQSLASGAINTVVATNAPTVSGAVLTFAAVPAAVQPGQNVQDNTTSGAIALGTTVLSRTPTTVTLSAGVTGGGVLSADSIIFSNLQPQLVSSALIAATQFGSGSMAAEMVGKYRQNDPTGELWVLPLVDDPNGTAATGSIVVSGTPTVNSTIPLYVDGISIPVGVTTTMSTNQVASAISAAINAATDGYTGVVLPLTASPATATVTITARHKGSSGNDIDFRLAYYGAAAGETIPAGLTITITPMSGGATNPSTLMNLLLPNLMDQPFDFICMPYTDTNSLNATQSFMNDITGRWSWERQDFGGVFSAAQGTVSALQTLGAARNDQHISIMGYFSSPSPSWHWAAVYCGASSRSLRADPGLPLHYLPLVGVFAPSQAQRFQMVDQLTLSFSGISAFDVGQDGTCIIKTDFTTYQSNAAGVPDDSYLKVETMFLLAACLRFMRAGVTTVMARKKLADDGTRVSPGSNLVTPVIIKAYLIALYQQMVNLGWVQDLPGFSANVIVQRNALNANRVDVLWPGVLINQLDVFALLAQFRLSSASFNVQLAA